MDVKCENNAPPQILILLWHHFCYYKRHWFKLIITIILPLVLILPVYLMVDALTNGSSQFTSLEWHKARINSKYHAFSAGPLHFAINQYCQKAGRYSTSNDQNWQLPPLEQINQTNSVSYCQKNTPSYWSDQGSYSVRNPYYRSDNVYENKYRCDRDTARDGGTTVDCTVSKGYVIFYPNSSHYVQNIAEEFRGQLENYAMLGASRTLDGDTKPKGAGSLLLNSVAKADLEKRFTETKNRIITVESYAEAIKFVSKMADEEAEWKQNRSDGQFYGNEGVELKVFWGIVGFDDMSDSTDVPTNVNYKIVTRRRRVRWSVDFIDEFDKTTRDVFQLQTLLENTIVKVASGKTTPMTAMYRNLPLKCHKRPKDYIYVLLSFVIPAACLFSFLPIGINFLEQVITEKWLKLREYMYIQGVGGFTLKFSWILFYMIFLLPMTIGFALIFAKFPHVFASTDISIILILFLLYNISQLAFCYLLASLFKTPNRSGLLYSFIFIFLLIFCMCLFTHTLDMNPMNVVLARVLSLQCAMPMSLGVAFIIDWERNWLGASWSVAMQTSSGRGLYCGFGECMLWLIFDTILYIALAWYIEHVAPGDYGVKHKPWFFLTPSFWCPGMFKKNLAIDFGDHKADVEAVSPNAIPGITISNMSMAYTAEKIGLKNLNLNFYEGEITAFLGQNGAGKSTTMNSLVGLITPTTGNAQVAGLDIRTQMHEIRQKVGFVPQYDILYPSLTVLEHLQFFGWLKGLSKQEMLILCAPLLQKVGLHEHLNATTTKMSGGQKRKLSVLTAYLGEPEVVILDEPTSGVDPYSRRAIWDLILEAQKGGTTILSTHHMEEADLLGQRIAIINDGSLKTFGTPMFLKNKYGLGFKLIIAAADESSKTEIKSFVHNQIPDSELIQESGNDLNFSVPLLFSRSNKMVEVLQTIENNQNSLKIASFGISEPTMEEIFFAATGMKRMLNQPNQEEIVEEFEQEATTTMLRLTMEDTNGTHVGDSSEIQYRKIDFATRFFGQFCAFFMKRVRYAIRSISGFLFQIVLPLVFIALYLLIGQNAMESSGKVTVKSNTLNLWLKPYQNVLFLSDRYAPGGLSSFSSMTVKSGLGPRCTSGLGSNSCDGPEGKWSVARDDQDLLEPPENCSCFGPCNVAPEIPKTNSPSNNIFYDLGENDINQWVVQLNQSSEMFVGGFEAFKVNKAKMEEMNISNELRNYIFNNLTDNYVVVWSTPQLRQAIANVFANMMYKMSMDDVERSITGTLEEIDLGTLQGEVSNNDMAEIFGPIFGCLFISLAFGFALLGIANFIQYENASGLKRLQIMAGGSRIVYWLANFVFDFVQFMVTLAAISILLATVTNSYQDYVGFILLTMIPYGLCSIGFTYVCSFLFTDAGGIIRLQIITLFICLIASGVLCSFAVGNWACMASAPQHEKLGFGRLECPAPWSPIVAALCDIYPFHYLVHVTVTIAMYATISELRKEDVAYMKLFAPNGLVGLLQGRIVDAMVTAIVLFLIVILLEYRSVQLSLACDCCGCCGCCRCCCCKVKQEENRQIVTFNDADVAAESERIAQTDVRESSLVVNNIVKQYSANARPAVNGVSFGVNKGECFGLLGINGAGKTTLFKMLTGYLKPTFGTATINGVSFNDRRRMMNEMNYCPQENVLFDLLTPEEHLNLFSTLHGVPGYKRKEYVRCLADDVGLLPHMKKYSTELSGGNQRKLQFAMSLMDSRNVMFLDEPTTGLDPGSRRKVWSCIQNAIKKRGSSVVLTSHSMDECEALCNRLVIMVSGQLRCIGSVQYLKDKFGNQYTFKIKSSVGSRRGSIDKSVNEIDAFIKSKLPNAILVEQHSSVVSYKVAAYGLRLSQLFELLNNAKQQFEIEDFTVTQTTLEHVFVSMAETQQTIESGLEVNLDATGQFVMVPPPSYNQVVA